MSNSQRPLGLLGSLAALVLAALVGMVLIYPPAATIVAPILAALLVELLRRMLRRQHKRRP